MLWIPYRSSCLTSIPLASRTPCEVMVSRLPALTLPRHPLTWWLVDRQTRGCVCLTLGCHSLHWYSLDMVAWYVACRWMTGRLLVEGNLSTWTCRPISSLTHWTVWRAYNRMMWTLTNITIVFCFFFYCVLQLWWNCDSLGSEDGERVMVEPWAVRQYACLNWTVADCYMCMYSTCAKRDA